MGIFSGETKHIVRAFVSSEPLIDPDDYTNTRQEFMMSAIRHANEDIAENLIASNLTGFAVHAKRFAEYGISSYAYSPPAGQFTYSNYITPALTTVIENNIYYNSPDVYVKSVSIGPMQYYFFAVFRLWRDYQVSLTETWNPVAYREDFENFYIYDRYGNYRRCQNQPYITDTYVNGKLYLKIMLPGYYGSAPHAEITELERNAEDIPGVGVHPTGLWYHTRVGFYDDLDRIDYWFYNVDWGTYPTLAVEAKPWSYYMPVGVLMRDKVYYNDTGNQHVIDSTPVLFKHLNMNPEDIITEVKAQDVQENVEKYDFFVNFVLDVELIKMPGLALGDNVALAGSAYAFAFAQAVYNPSDEHWIEWMNTALAYGDYMAAKADLWESDPDQYPEPEFWGTEGLVPTSQGVSIQVAGGSGYTAYHSWNFIKHASNQSSTGAEPNFWYGFNDYWSRVPTKWSQFYPGIPEGLQISKEVTAGQWESYYVAGLLTQYGVNTIDGLRIVDDDTSRLPINLDLLYTLNNSQQERVLQEALHGTMFLVYDESYKVKWYQSGLFKVLFVVVTIIVVVLLQQYEFSGVLFTLMGVAVTQAILLQAAVGWLISFVASNVLTGELGMVFAVAISIYMSGGLAGFSSKVTSAFTQMSNITFNSAVGYLKTVTDIYTYFEGEEIQDEFAELSYEIEDWEKTTAEKQEELDEKYYAMYETESASLDPLTIMDGVMGSMYVESPDNFLNRTLAQNPGVQALDLIQNFYDIVLTVPDTPGQPNPLATLNNF